MHPSGRHCAVGRRSIAGVNFVSDPGIKVAAVANQELAGFGGIPVAVNVVTDSIPPRHFALTTGNQYFQRQAFDVTANLRNAGNYCRRITLTQGECGHLPCYSQIKFVLVEVRSVEVQPELTVAVCGDAVSGFIDRTAAFVVGSQSLQIAFAGNRSRGGTVFIEPTLPVAIIVISQLTGALLTRLPENRKLLHSGSGNFGNDHRIRRPGLQHFLLLDVLQELQPFPCFGTNILR